MPTDSIPESLIQALPNNFQLAYYTGHLWYYADWDGKIKLFKPNPLFQKAKKGAEFKRLLNSAKSDTSMLVFTPVAYPNIFCVMPNESIDTLFEETYFPAWLDYIDQWQDKEELNQKLNSSLQELIIANNEKGKVINALNNGIAEYDRKIAQTNQNIIHIIPEINAARKKLGLAEIKNEIVAYDGDDPDPRPPFNLRIPYDKSNDPFMDVVKRYSKDISDKPWATDQMEGGKYLDGELADKVQEVNDKFDKPESISDEGLRNQVKDLKAKGFKGINVTSGTRTPMKQAHLYSNAKSNNNPVAQYTGSMHLFGQAADMSLPAGWGWGSPNHKALRGVLAKMGISMNVPNDPVHFSIGKPTQGTLSQRLAMARAYNDKAKAIKEGQAAVKDNLVFEAGKAGKQKDQLDKDIEAKTGEIEAKSSLFTRASARYNQLQRDLGSLNGEIARREAEARNKEREGHEHFDRPRPEAPAKEHSTPEKPARERDKPSRETGEKIRLG